MEGADGDVKIGVLQAGVIFFKSCFGVGVLGMPFAFRNAGVIAGVISLVFIGLATNVATKMLVWVKRDLQRSRGLTSTSIPVLAGALFGSPGQAWANVLVILSQCGCCIAYNIFLGVSLTAIVESLIPDNHIGQAGYDPYVFFVVCQVLLFSLMVQIKEIASLSPLLIFAQFAMVVAVVTIIGHGLLEPSVCDRDGQEKIFCKVHSGFRPETFAIFVGIAVAAMEGIPTVLAIEHSMAEPDRFEEMFDRAQSLLAAVFVVFGCTAYWLYGNNTRSVVTLNCPGTVGLVVKMLLVMVIFCSFPLQFVPVGQVTQTFVNSESLQRRIGRLHAALPQWAGVFFGKKQIDLSNRVMGALKIVCVIITGIVAVLVPHFGHVLSLMGCCVFSTITYVLPPVMFLKSRQGQHQFQHVIMCCLLMMFGLCVTFVGLYGNIMSKTVWHHKIEKAPPLAGSEEAKRARAVFNSAAGAIKKNPFFQPGADGLFSPLLAGASRRSPTVPTDGGQMTAVSESEVRARKKPVQDSIDAKRKFYRDAEAVAKMEGMVQSSAQWHKVVPPKWKKKRETLRQAAIKAAAVHKILQLKKMRSSISSGTRASSPSSSWAKVDSYMYKCMCVCVTNTGHSQSLPNVTKLHRSQRERSKSQQAAPSSVVKYRYK